MKRLFNYPEDSVRFVLQSEDRNRFLFNVNLRLRLRTLYSGTGPETVLLSWIAQAMRKLEPHAGHELYMHWFETACDKDTRSQKFLKHLSEIAPLLGPECIHKNLLSRVPKPALTQAAREVQWPSARIKGGDANYKARVKAAVEETYSILVNSFDKGGQSGCVRHGEDCPHYRYADIDWPQEEPEPDEARPTKLTSAGVTCVDYINGFGSGLHAGGESTLPCLAFLAEAHQLQDDAVIMECSSRWDRSLLEPLLSTHTLHYTQQCCTHFGWPVKRERFYGLLSNNKTLLCTKPFEEFAPNFHRPVEIEAHSLYCESAENVQAALVACVEHQIKKHGLLKDMNEPLDWEKDALDDVKQARLQQYRVLHQKRLDKFRQRGDPPDSYSEHLICDLGQEADGRLRLNSNGRLPGLLTHGFEWSDKHRRLLLKRERVSFQGWPVIPEVHGADFDVPWINYLQDNSEGAAKHLFGNGMHAQVMFTFLLWLLACFDRIDAIPNIVTSPSPLTDEDEELENSAAHADDGIFFPSKRARVET